MPGQKEEIAFRLGVIKETFFGLAFSQAESLSQVDREYHITACSFRGLVLSNALEETPCGLLLYAIYY